MRPTNQVTSKSTNIRLGAHYIGMSPGWVRSAVNSGLLPHLRIGRSIRLLISDLDKFLSDCHRDGAVHHSKSKEIQA